jgi:hypothetical protein
LIHFYKRDEAEKGLLLTRRAPDTSAVRSPSIEDRCYGGDQPEEEMCL